MKMDTMSKPASEPAIPEVAPPGANGPLGHEVSHRVAGSGPEVLPSRDHRSWVPPWLLFNVLLPVGILAAGAAAVWALGSKAPETRVADDQSLAGRLSRLPAAEVAPILSLQEVGQPLELRVDGVVIPYREVQLAAEVAGRIIEKSSLCEAGNFVRSGDLLVKVDPTDYAQEVERLSRMREQEYEALREVDQEMANTKRLIEIAERDIELQQREVDRLSSLPRGFVSEGEVDRASKLLLTANQSRVALDNQFDSLTARRMRLEAAERMARTQLRSAEINLQRTEIRSPIDGVIVSEDAELNSFIQRGSSIVTIEDVGKVEVAVNLRMDQLHWVLDQENKVPIDSEATPETKADRLGYRLPVTEAVIEYEVAGLRNRKYRWEGRLQRYAGIGLDPSSRTVPVIVVVDNPTRMMSESSDGFSLSDSRSADKVSPQRTLVRGMFVTVRLLVQPKTPLFAIPAVAIRPGNRLWHFLPDDSVLQAAEPETATDSPAPPPTFDRAASSGFDPALWVPGRLRVLSGVTPVDSLWLPGSGANRGGAELDRYWICEIEGNPVRGGDWVVRSPLGDFGDSQIAVRVLAESLSPRSDSPESVDPQPITSTQVR